MLPRKTLLFFVFLGGILVAILAGFGSYTFYYAEGFSYFSKEPAACANCHIMRPQLDSWQKSSHHTSATCAGCHLPVDFPANYIAKAINGWNHSKAFTMENFHEPIEITPLNSKILRTNCLRCHQDVVHSSQLDDPMSKNMNLPCVHCHAGVGHGERVGLGGPMNIENELERMKKGNHD